MMDPEPMTFGTLNGLVCDFCLSNVFTKASFTIQAHAFVKAKFTLSSHVVKQAGCEYTTKVAQVRASASKGCTWCRLIFDLLPIEQRRPSTDETIAAQDVFNAFNESSWMNAYPGTEPVDPVSMVELGQLYDPEFRTPFTEPGSTRAPNASDNIKVAFEQNQDPHSKTPKASNVYKISIDEHPDYFTAFTQSHDPAADLIPSNEHQHQTNTPYAFHQARLWLKDCGSHRECPEQGGHRLPTRVIEVTPDLAGASRLITSHGISGIYAALSYCWGGPQPCVTTSENLEQHLCEIPLGRVSRTIRDAIRCTKELGIRYLWVDALCIIQDSTEDKTRELACIREVFRGAHVTIVAASASDASQGFLHDRPSPEPSYEIPVWTKHGRRAAIHLRKAECINSRKQEPVSTRAWTLEERILSPRLLLYESDTLRWHCQTKTKTLEDLVDLPEQVFGTGNADLVSRQVQTGSHTSHRSRATDALDPLTTWTDIIEDYTRRHMTYPEDRLRALGGLAEDYHLRHGFKYIAGLWEGEFLPALLLWCYAAEMRSEKPRTEYLAPSWSWASTTKSVRFPGRLGANKVKWFDCQLLSVSIELKSTITPFSQVTHGFLRLRGRVKRAVYDSALDSTLYWIREERIDPPPGRTRRSWKYRRFPTTGEPVTAHSDFYMSRREVECLATSRRKYNALGKTETKVVCGLLIAPTGPIGVYERVGVFFDADEKDWKGCPRRVVTLV